jgi:hypothetical protein
MAVRQLSRKLSEAIQSFWDVLESAYYGRFSLHEDGASPISQLFKVGTALSIAMSASILTSAIALPLVLPVVIFWCLVAPCTGRPARSGVPVSHYSGWSGFLVAALQSPFFGLGRR